jgi:hypothetical protein
MTYSCGGEHSGAANAIRFMYGKGHVLLIGTHPESRSGSNGDWMTRDDYVEDTNTISARPPGPVAGTPVPGRQGPMRSAARASCRS